MSVFSFMSRIILAKDVMQHCFIKGFIKNKLLL